MYVVFTYIRKYVCSLHTRCFLDNSRSISPNSILHIIYKYPSSVRVTYVVFPLKHVTFTPAAWYRYICITSCMYSMYIIVCVASMMIRYSRQYMRVTLLQFPERYKFLLFIYYFPNKMV